jgi:hypothetical protein
MAALSRAARSIDFWLLTLSFEICGFSISGVLEAAARYALDL